MNELLLHEAGLGALPGGLGPSTASKSPIPGLQRETSSSEGEGEEEGGGWAEPQSIPENSEDESSDEEFTMKVPQM